MIKKFIAALAVSAVALLLTATPALAAPYPPNQVETTQIIVAGTSNAVATAAKPPAQKPPVTKPQEAPSTIQVLPTSGSAGNLSYTGVSFNVPLTLTIAGLVVLAGFMLVFFGGRGVARGRRTH